MSGLSANTQAILLLTAPLLAGGGKRGEDLLTPSEYKRLALHLRGLQRQPGELLTPNATDLLRACSSVVAEDRLQGLLGRGFLLSQAVEHWQARAIWVLSRADADYPRRLKARLREDAPAVLYGCGDRHLLEQGGLAVVGSRHVDDALLEYALETGRLTAKAGKPLVSGGAKGIDQAAMRGALEQGGKVLGLLADNLEKTALNREHRNLLLEGRLVLASAYDPNAGFNVGNAMQRNKLIYALADAALVVNAEAEKGGTWAGAAEQLNKLRLVPVYVRQTGAASEALNALRHKGALAWPEPKLPTDLQALLSRKPATSVEAAEQLTLPLTVEEPKPGSGSGRQAATPAYPALADALFAHASGIILQLLATPLRDTDIADALQINQPQAASWLARMVNEGKLQQHTETALFGLPDNLSTA